MRGTILHDAQRTTLRKLFGFYPKGTDFKVETLRLQYTDAVNLDFTRENALEFLKEKFKTTIQLPPTLFDGHVQARPKSFSWQAGNFRGRPTRRYRSPFASATGGRDSRPALIWETIVESTVDELPALPRGSANG